jgi:hypothetical protein
MKLDKKNTNLKDFANEKNITIKRMRKKSNRKKKLIEGEIVKKNHYKNYLRFYKKQLKNKDQI